MKYFFSILFFAFFFIFCSNTAFAQQKQTLQVGQNSIDVLPSLIDTLYVQEGRPYLFLIDVPEGDVQSFGDSKEEKELRANFKENAFQIVKINQHLLVLFGNKKFLDLRNTDSSYQFFAYWSGNLAHDIEIKGGANMATEFVATQMGLKKESSYVINGRKYQAEVSALKLEKNITDKSKLVMNEVLYDASSVMPKDKGDFGDLFKIKKPNIKSINTFITREGKKALLKSLTMNDLGQVTEIRFFSSSGSGKERGKVNFLYDKGILSQMIEEDSSITKVFYDNEKMILVKKTDELTKTDIYWIENDELLLKSYEIRNDNALGYANSYRERKISNNCINDYFDGRLWAKNCDSKKGVFPYLHTYIRYQDDGTVLQFRKTKIEKKDENTYQIFGSKAQAEEQKDDYHLFAIIYLNQLGLVGKFDIIDKEKKGIVEIQYSFYK